MPDYPHPPDHLHIAMLEAHPLPAAMVLSEVEYAAVNAELEEREASIRRKLVDRYLSSIG